MFVKRTYKPVTSSQRFRVGGDFSILTKKKPFKKLLRGKKKISGRNNYGIISVRRRGGGHKRRYRIIDFKRRKFDIYGKVISVEYDPNRNAYIALISYDDGEKCYIIAPKGLLPGMKIVSSLNIVNPFLGNALILKNIPLGVFVHNIELYPGAGAKLVRSAGSVAQLVSREGDYCNLKLPSGEMRRFLSSCMATIGQVGNIAYQNIVIAKAGRSRWLGRRPKVRGVAMNPIDHPHGGGNGKTSTGRHPVTPWGKPCKGYKTRKLKKLSSRLIMSRKK